MSTDIVADTPHTSPAPSNVQPSGLAQRNVVESRLKRKKKRKRPLSHMRSHVVFEAPVFVTRRGSLAVVLSPYVCEHLDLVAGLSCCVDEIDEQGRVVLTFFRKAELISHD